VPRRYVDRESALRSVANGLSRPGTVTAEAASSIRAGGTTIPHSWKLKYAGNCTAPVYVFRDGVRLTKGKAAHIFGRHPMERPVMTELEVPCRQCPNCLRRRAAHWRIRAYAEYRAAARTWFGTLTLSPDQHYQVLQACRLVASKNGDDFDLFPSEQQFAERHRCISREITLYVKRLRKYSGAELRLLCVCEAHKSGLPHYHILIHEVNPQLPVRHSLLKKQWRVGFSDFKLVTSTAAAGYVTKYLSKSAQARVRASLDYGNTSSDVEFSELVKGNLTSHPARGMGTELEEAGAS